MGRVFNGMTTCEINRFSQYYHENGWVKISAEVLSEHDLGDDLLRLPEVLKITTIDSPPRTQIYNIYPLSGHQYALSSSASMVLHTDNAYAKVPCTLIALYCISPADVGGDTLLVNASHVIQGLSKETRQILEKKIWSWRFPDNKKSSERFSVFNRNTKHVRWGINYSGRLPEEDLEDVQEFLRAIYSGEAITEIQMKAGDLLIIDNLRMLHGRKSFKGNRHYVRVRYW